jgi:D-hexose-6-phosphate mutarotase
LSSVETKLAELDSKEAELLDTFYRKYPIVAINKIPVQGLPAERLLKHSNKSGDVLEAALTRELDTFKHELTLKYVIGNEPIDELISLLNQVL